MGQVARPTNLNLRARANCRADDRGSRPPGSRVACQRLSVGLGRQQWVHLTPVTFSGHQTLSWSLFELGTPNLVTQIEVTLQSISKNDKSQKRDDAFPIWSDALSQQSIEQPPDRRQKGKCYQTHTTSIDQRIILPYVQILLDFRDLL
jgi:hypothetical protein